MNAEINSADLVRMLESQLNGIGAYANSTISNGFSALVYGNRVSGVIGIVVLLSMSFFIFIASHRLFTNPDTHEDTKFGLGAIVVSWFLAFSLLMYYACLYVFAPEAMTIRQLIGIG